MSMVVLPACLLLLLLLLLQVQSGAGRSGMWWAHGQFDGGAMQPDMVVFAKGIASGYPLAGARSDLIVCSG
jgi:4-aminobutyrate aminotransferase-like enzyme